MTQNPISTDPLAVAVASAIAEHTGYKATPYALNSGTTPRRGGGEDYQYTWGFRIARDGVLNVLLQKTGIASKACLAETILLTIDGEAVREIKSVPSNQTLDSIQQTLGNGIAERRYSIDHTQPFRQKLSQLFKPLRRVLNKVM